METVVNNSRTEFPNEVMAELPQSFPVGIGRVEDVHYCVSVAEGLKDLAHALFLGVRAKTLRDVVTLEDIESMLTNLVRLRCLQLVQALPTGVRSSDIQVPEFFFPFLAYINKVDVPLRSQMFIPYYAEGVENAEGQKEVEDRQAQERSAAREMVNNIDRVARSLKAVGVGFTPGLPKIMVTSDDTCLRILETEEGEFLVAGGRPAETDLLLRSVVRMGFQPENFGEARTRYSRVDDYRNSLYRIVEAAYPPIR